MAHVWVSLQQDDDGFPPFTEEQLHTEEVAEDRHRVASTPAFAQGIAVGDVLATSTLDEGEVWATHVDEAGDHWCSRVVPLDGCDPEQVVAVMNSMGGVATVTPYGVITVDFSADVDAQHVLTELKAGFDDGEWDYDLGVAPEVARDV